MRLTWTRSLLLFAWLGPVGCGGGQAGRSDGGGELQDGNPPPQDGARADGPLTTWGAGTSVYRRNTLVLVSDPGSTAVQLAAQVFGLSGVEIVADGADGGFESAFLPAPSPSPSGSQDWPVPLVIAKEDITGDGLDDLLLSASTGHWYWPRHADGGFGSATTDEFTARLDSAGSASECLEGMDPGGLHLLAWNCDGGDFPTVARIGATWSMPKINALPAWQFHDIALVSDRAISLPAAGPDPASLVYLSSVDARLVRYAVTADGTLSLVGAMTQSPVSPPYLKPFDSFDHLQALTLAGCAPSAIGVGVFNVDIKGTRRQIEQLELTGTTSYVTKEIATSFDVVTLAVVPGDDGTAIVAALGQDGAGATFVAYRIDSCDQWTQIAIGETDFDWRSPPAPSFGADGPNVPKTNGVDLLGVRAAASADGGSTAAYRYFHYDGYDLREWRLNDRNGSSGDPGFTFRRVSVHTNRDDHLF